MLVAQFARERGWIAILGEALRRDGKWLGSFIWGRGRGGWLLWFVMLLKMDFGVVSGRISEAKTDPFLEGAGIIYL